MQRICQQCGQPFEAQRSSAKFCSSSCRARRSTGAAPVVDLEVPKSPGDAEPRIVRVTREALEAADRLDTPLGAAALLAAERAARPSTSDSAVPALLKQHAASLAEALRGTASATAPQQLRDELAERRRKHA